MVGLVDCNNFYVSCERLFNPSLNGHPVIVLSNNDGCVISRSNKAKNLGIKMGAPLYKCMDLIEKYDVAVYSSNYPLYGDLSNRIMTLLGGFVEEYEIYSIDESFLSFEGFRNYNLYEYGENIVKKTVKGTGIPVSLGIGETKTLAKVANRFAKKYPGYKSVCIVDNEDKRIKALKLFDIADVWGIGRRQAAKLERIGVITVYDFTLLPMKWVRKNMTIAGRRTYRELLGESCIDVEMISPARKQICTSRSFGKIITAYQDISEAVANYASSCVAKLRQQKSVAFSLMVFVHTNHYRKDLPQYAKSIIVNLPVPTYGTGEIVRYAEAGLKKIFLPGYMYKKAGVIITEIVDQDSIQMNFFHSADVKRSDRLMQAIDKINGKYRHSLRLAAQGNAKNSKWQLKQEWLSQCYTTNINEILSIKCG
ncbi:MAG: Y-family DNA polymerase [Parabacteroides sp.]|nr:Y-family DNA polymerase [Parabacteroides sp.]